MRDDRLTALDRALTWLHASCLDIFPPRPTWVAWVKRLAEGAMLADVLLDDTVRALSPSIAEHGNGWLDACWKLLRRGDFLAECVANDRRWVGLAATYVPFYRHGRRNERFEQLLRDHADEVETGSFVRLAVACAYRHLGISSRLSIAALIAEQWVARADEYTVADPVRAYETSHVIFWLAALDQIPPAMQTRLVEWTPRWIAHYQKVRNVDIVSELVLMQHYVRGPVAREVWDWLLAQQDPDGSFPGLELPTRAMGRFHPTLVTAMALARCVGRTHCDCS